MTLWHEGSDILRGLWKGGKEHTKWNRRVGGGVGGGQRREREGHGETRTGFKVPRRNEQLEEKSALGGVCLFGTEAVRACAHVHVHLYTAAYLFCLVYSKQALGPERESFAKKIKNLKSKHLPIQLSVSS